MTESTPVPPPAPDPAEDDTEGHWYKWHLEDDGKGGQRLRSKWVPNDQPPTQTAPTGASAPKKSSERR
jgi:hypothetical protein